MGERIGVTDEEWALIGPLLAPHEIHIGARSRVPSCTGQPPVFRRHDVDRARTGAQWRPLRDDYGKWNSIFRRSRRWVTAGVFDAMLEMLAEPAGRDATADMIDSTVVRAHHCAVGIKVATGRVSARSRREASGIAPRVEPGRKAAARPARPLCLLRDLKISPKSWGDCIDLDWNDCEDCRE